MKLLYSLLGKTKLFLCLIMGATIMHSCQVEPDAHNLSLQDIDIDNKEIPDSIDFNFHIKPIISDRCFKCHGPDKNKIEAGLSFFSFESATTALGEEQDHFAIVPFKPKDSELVYRINATEPGVRMPPPESHLSLNEYEKKLLTKWIEQGAAWKEHWAFLPVSSVAIPSLAQEKNRARNPIDHFVLASLPQRRRAH